MLGRSKSTRGSSLFVDPYDDYQEQLEALGLVDGVKQDTHIGHVNVNGSNNSDVEGGNGGWYRHHSSNSLEDSELDDLGEDIDPLLNPGGNLGMDEMGWAIQRQQRHFNLVLTWRAVIFSIFISVVNLGMLVVEFVVNHGWTSKTVWVNVKAEVLIDLGAKVTILIQQGQVHRLFTPMFLHVGLLHLIVNTITLFGLSIQVEATLGFWRTAFVYIMSGIGGNIVSAIFLPKLIEVGASSSLFGLVGVYFVDIIVNWSVHPSRRRNLTILIVTTLISFLFGFFPHIDNFAHLGGFITGVVASFIIMPSVEIPSPMPSKVRKQKRKQIIRIIASCVLLIVLFAVGVIILLSKINLWNWCPFCEWISCLPIYPACRDNRTGQ